MSEQNAPSTGDFRHISLPQSFPHCIVWSPIPVCTWIFPFIGHLGICSSQGVIYDFAGCVHVGNFSFGHATKYVQLNPAAALALNTTPDLLGNWDKALHYAETVFNGKMYSFCGNNCHRFVAHCLEQVGFGGREEWGEVYLGWLMFWYGKNTSWAGTAKTYLPFIFFAVAMFVFSHVPVWSLLTIWMGTSIALVFLLHLADLAQRRLDREARGMIMLPEHEALQQYSASMSPPYLPRMHPANFLVKYSVQR